MLHLWTVPMNVGTEFLWIPGLLFHFKLVLGVSISILHWHAPRTPLLQLEEGGNCFFENWHESYDIFIRAIELKIATPRTGSPIPPGHERCLKERLSYLNTTFHCKAYELQCTLQGCQCPKGYQRNILWENQQKNVPLALLLFPNAVGPYSH